MEVAFSRRGPVGLQPMHYWWENPIKVLDFPRFNPKTHYIGGVPQVTWGSMAPREWERIPGMLFYPKEWPSIPNLKPIKETTENHMSMDSYKVVDWSKVEGLRNTYEELGIISFDRRYTHSLDS